MTDGLARGGVLARLGAWGYVAAVAKRMLLQFRKGGYPAYDWVDEQGMAQPCALGVPWVNDDTLRTLARLRIPRTDPRGRPLPESEAEAEVPGAR